MVVQVSIEGPTFGRASICVPILRALPEWFGIEEAIGQYGRDIDELPTFLAWTDSQIAGFVTLKHHNEGAAEVLVMGVSPDLHRQGVGQHLLRRAEQWLKESGTRYLQVKTLGPSHPDESYAKTREFYLAMGFWPLEEIPTLWGESNPALMMVKALA